MANIKSAKKRILVNKTKYERNKAAKSAIKTAIKKVEVAVETKIDNSKAIEELNNNIKSWEAQLERSRNNILNAELHDKIMAARKQIRDLSSQLPPARIVEAKAPTVTDRDAVKKRMENFEDHTVRII